MRVVYPSVTPKVVSSLYYPGYKIFPTKIEELILIWHTSLSPSLRSLFHRIGPKGFSLRTLSSNGCPSSNTFHVISVLLLTSRLFSLCLFYLFRLIFTTYFDQRHPLTLRYVHSETPPCIMYGLLTDGFLISPLKKRSKVRGNQFTTEYLSIKRTWGSQLSYRLVHVCP